MKAEWIRTEDTAPEPYKAVLVYIPGRGVPVTGTRMKKAGMHLKWRIGNQILRRENNPTHWMELPSPPAGGGGGGG